MKTIFRLLSITALVAGIAVTGAFAQDDVCTQIDSATALYDKFTANYNKRSSTDLLVAINAGKEFLEKYGACESWKDQVAFVKPWVPKLEDKKAKAELDEYLNPRFAKYDAAILSDNADDLYSAGKEILAKQPNNMNIMFPLAIVGPREILKKNNKYNAESLRYAKSVYDYLKGGGELTRVDTKGVKTNTIGALKHEMNRENAISELVYTLGYVNFYGLNNKKAALPYLYEVTQTAGFRKTYAPVYATIGDYYLAEAAPIGAEIAKLIEAIKNAPTEEEKVKINEEAKAKEALFNGYTERTMDAYSRAYRNVDDKPASKPYKDGLLKEVQRLYKLRFEKEDGVDQWITAAVAKPLPDPTSAVQPVVDEPKVTTTTTGTGTGVGAANSSGVGAANGTGVGTPSGKTVGNAVPAKPVAKKPRR